MALDISAIRTALATKIRNAYSGVWSVNVYDYPTEAPVMPCVIIRTAPAADAIDYHESMGVRGQAKADFEIEVRVIGWDVDAVKKCDAVLSTGTDESMFDAVAAMGGSAPYSLTGLPGVSAVIRSASGPVRVATDSTAETWTAVKFLLTASSARG